MKIGLGNGMSDFQEFFPDRETTLFGLRAQASRLSQSEASPI
jgi:hypothetical protein